MVIGHESLLFSDSLQYCDDLGMELASIHGAGAMEEARSLCNSVDHSGSVGCWVGLTREDNGQPWYWTDGSILDYGFDANGHPTTGVYPWHSGICAHLLSPRVGVRALQ